MTRHQLTTGQQAALACLWEVTATKPGNIHRGADFEDATFVDFATSAVALVPAFDRAHLLPLGAVVLRAIGATKQFVGTNTNLGMVLLMAPLALVREGESQPAGVRRVLDSLTQRDAHDVYAAIRLAQPGGLGTVDEADVTTGEVSDLVAAMRLAAERDLVARQYANGFQELLGFVVPAIQEGLARGWSLDDVIIHTHLRVMQAFPDSLIARKCGIEVAQRASQQAGQALTAGEPGSEEYQRAISDLDFWLRSDHHRRNPGTTADLVAAGLFAALRSGIIALPVQFYPTSANDPG